MGEITVTNLGVSALLIEAGRRRILVDAPDVNDMNKLIEDYGFPNMILPNNTEQQIKIN